MLDEIRRLAIVNRGEAAMRLIHAVRELNREGDERIATIALFTDPDQRAMYVREADEAVSLGPPMIAGAREGERRSAYLDYVLLETALRTARADAAWVGWGFVAEHPEFAELCDRLGIVFVGPPPAVMRRLGDKISSKRLAEEVGVAVAPWSGGPLSSVEDARRHAERLGYPLMIKASSGGGGRGIRAVSSPDELAPAFERARAEALGSFGDATVFLERRIEPARHVEVQIIADHHGTTWAVGVRDCTIQRRHQKVMEESPSPALSAAQDRELCAAAVRIAEAAGYQNAGTVEFLLDPSSGRFFFMEVNARLQVEHPVSEMTSGLDLVKLQLHVARGGRLQGDAPVSRGHAIEVRLCAEDPDEHFAPAPGRIELLRLATGPGMRIDTGVAAGDRIAPEFDSMVAKIIAHGADRTEAIARLERALGDSAVAIRGGCSNKAFLLALLGRPEVRSASADNRWLDEVSARGELVAHEHADVALLQAAIDAYDEEARVELAQFLAAASRGRPQVRREVGADIELRLQGQTYRFGVRRFSGTRYRVVAGDSDCDVEVERPSALERRLRYRGEQLRVLSIAQGLEALIEVNGVPHRISRDASGIVRAPMPAVVLALSVQVGDVVAPGDRLAVLEAMKMETPVVAPVSGRVREILVTTNVQVDAGAPLVVLEPLVEVGAVATTPRVAFAPTPASSPSSERERWRRCRDELRQLLLGFDLDRGEVKALLREWATLIRALPPDDPELLEGEDALLELFADLHALFRRQRGGEDTEELQPHSPQEYLLTYLRSLDGKGEGLPPDFQTRLRIALQHYGVQGLEHTTALEESLVRIYKAHERADEQVEVAIAILTRRLERHAELVAAPLQGFGALLDLLIGTARGRFPDLHDLACEIRQRYLDEPLFVRVRSDVYMRALGVLDELASERDETRRATLIDELVDCPQPLVTTFLSRLDRPAEAIETMLLVLTRRYYRIRRLERVRTSRVGKMPWLAGEYEYEGRRIELLTTFTTFSGLADAIVRSRELVSGVPAEHDIVLDLYVWQPEGVSDVESTQRHLRELLARAAWARPLRRVVFAIAGPGEKLGMGGVLHFTYRPSPQGYVEERPLRGLHPMMGKRMHLWRLSNFEIERLPSAEDVYLFRAVGRENVKDVRLFALAEVRDVTPVRDEAGRLTHLPLLEHVLTEAIAAMRRFQAHLGPAERPQWNRVFLYVWPPLLLPRAELESLVHRLAPLTEGVGLEQVVVRARMPNPETGAVEDTVLRISNAGAQGLLLTFGRPPTYPLRPLGEYEQKVMSLRRRGLVYAYELVHMLTPGREDVRAAFPPGEFVEYDLDDQGALVPVARPHGKNSANIVVGLMRSFTAKHPEGMERIALLGDASREMGSIAEPECRRIMAALALARELRLPVEWFALSAGAKISMESGTENMDWIARVLRELILFTQDGGEVNVIVTGINVGAQPYWNAEATMLMHTRGILVMIPDSAMVLTGKQALDYSGGVSAEDNQGIGGYERIMGPNGQAQYFARDLAEAAQILLRHYEHAYVKPGERFPRRAATIDVPDRDVRSSPHGGGDGIAEGFARIGDIFGDERNPGRKKPFEIRRVMAAAIDSDHVPLERWPDMRDAEIAVIWDAHIGGYPVCLIGLESKPLRRFGFVPADGPGQWTAGTLFPRSSKKVARAINAASGNRPLVVLANLSGFDGSPESMRNLQLEYGAEIGRAVVNFRGPIVFCVVSRYHGGAFVVFSRALNEHFEAAALEGAYASVIGGAPAAAVVFAREVDARVRKDSRVRDLEEQIARASEVEEKARLRLKLVETREHVRAEKLGAVADEFDHVHSVERALRMGSLDHIIPAARLRPYLIDALERGMRAVSA